MNPMAYDFILEEPDIIDKIQKEFDDIGVVNEEKNRLIVFFTVLGAKLLDDPVNIIFQGSSSSGKSLVSRSVLINFPKGYETHEYWTEATSTKPSKKIMVTEWHDGFGIVPLSNMTVASLYRIGLDKPTFFDKKLLFMGELPDKPSEEQVRVQQIIRQLLSEGEVSKSLVMGDKTVVIYLKGKPAFLSCDATLEIEEQLLNRTLILNPDESSDQTKAILKKQGLFAEKPWLRDPVMIASWLIDKIQEQLEPFQVLNRWGRKVSQFLSKMTSDPRVRRTNPMVLRFIELRTLLFQKQREVIYRKEYPDVHYLLTTREDVIETMMLLSETIFQTLIRILETSLNFLTAIQDQKNQEFWSIEIDRDGNETIRARWFSYQDFAEFNNTHKKSVYPHLKSLCEAGFLLLNKEKRTHELKLNVSRKTPLIGLEFLREDLESFFVVKNLPEGFESMSMQLSPGDAKSEKSEKSVPSESVAGDSIGEQEPIVIDKQSNLIGLEEVQSDEKRDSKRFGIGTHKATAEVLSEIKSRKDDEIIKLDFILEFSEKYTESYLKRIITYLLGIGELFEPERGLIKAVVVE